MCLVSVHLLPPAGDPRVKELTFEQGSSDLLKPSWEACWAQPRLSVFALFRKMARMWRCTEYMNIFRNKIVKCELGEHEDSLEEMNHIEKVWSVMPSWRKTSRAAGPSHGNAM